MKRSLLIITILLAACSSNPEGTDETLKANVNTQTNAAAQTVGDGIAALIARDLTGGVLFDSITVDSGNLPSPQSGREGGAPMALPLEGATQAPIIATPPTKVSLSAQVSTVPLELDSSFSYSGDEGEGRMVLVETGEGEDIYTPQTESHLYKFHPLNLRFIFYRYRFGNACLGRVYLHGEIACEVTGEYTSATGIFKGSAHCVNGPKKPETILYITDDANYNVELDVQMEINGSPYRTDSYRFQGNITIENVVFDITQVLAKDPICAAATNP